MALRIVDLSWRLKRAVQDQEKAFVTLYERRIEGSLYRTLNQLRRVHDQAQKAFQEDLSIPERWREEDWEAKKARIFGSCPPGPRPGAEEVVPGRTTHSADAQGRLYEEGLPTPSTPFRGPETPDGVTTNAQTGGQMRKTKPILEAVSGLKGDVASEMCKTKPIWEGVSNLK